MKILLYGTLLSSLLWSETIMCYKKNLPSKNIYKNISLNGKICKNNNLKTLKSTGWKLKDFKTTKNKLGLFDHIYILSKKTNRKIIQEKSLFDPTNKSYIIKNITSKTALIDNKKLPIGISGIVVHKYENNNSIIVSNAIVTSTNNNSSTITFKNSTILKQDAIPTTRLKPQNNDIFIANHLYNTSLLILPNLKAKLTVLELYKKQNFINEDFFATTLKINKTPVPTKQDIQQFCLENQIGTVFILIKNKLYIVDAISFQVIYTHNLRGMDSSTSTPFFTKIKDIEKGFWNILEKDKIEDYNTYYNSILFSHKTDTKKMKDL